MGFDQRARLVLTISLTLTAAASVWAQDQPGAPQGQKGAPIVFNGERLFTIQTSMGPFSAQNRAQLVIEKVWTLATDPLLKIDSIVASDRQGATDVVVGDLVITSVTDADASAVGKPRQQLAREYAQILRAAIGQFRSARSIRSIALGILFTLLATAALWFILRLLRKGVPRLCAIIRSWRGSRIRSVRIQSVELVPAGRIANALIAMVRVLHLALILFLVFFYFSIVFSLFPWTRGYVSMLLGYLRNGLAILGHDLAIFVPDLFFIVLLAVFTRYIIKFAKFLFGEVERGTIEFTGFYKEWAQPTYKIVRFLILALAAVMAFPYIPGSDSPAFKSISIFIGVLFSLGSTGAVSNIIAGIALTYTRAFQVGDRVKIGDAVGDVVEKTLLATRVRTVKNEDITVPNALVLGGNIVNFSSSGIDDGLILHTSVTIGYDTPWRTVQELLIAAACATRGVETAPAPFVLQTALDDFYVSYQINAYTKQPNAMMTIYSELHQNIQDKFNEAGVEICSPHYATLRDGNPIAIPPQYLPKDYQAPAFRVGHANHQNCGA